MTCLEVIDINYTGINATTGIKQRVAYDHRVAADGDAVAEVGRAWPECRRQSCKR